MNFVLRGHRGDLEAGNLQASPQLPARGLRMSPGGMRPSSGQSNPAAFLLTILLLFLVFHSQQVSPDILIWVGVAVFFMVTSLRMYNLCQQVQAQLGTAAAVASDQLRMSQGGIPLWSFYRGSRDAFEGLRLQLALLDRDFDELDYDALRALDPDNPPGVGAFSEAEINSLPSYSYKKAPPALCPFSEFSVQEGSGKQGGQPPGVDDLTCSVCLENILEGEQVRTLPCLHAFHQGCVDRWLRQQATCPVCKFKLGAIRNAG